MLHGAFFEDSNLLLGMSYLEYFVDIAHTVGIFLSSV